MNLNPEDVRALETAIAEEAEAVNALSLALDAIRSCGEALAPEGFDAALARARNCSDALALAGSRRVRCASSISKRSGLPQGAPLERVARRLGDRGRTVAGLGRELREALESLARHSGVLSLTLRYGASSCAQLVELRKNLSGTFSSYGPSGKLSSRAAASGRTA